MKIKIIVDSTADLIPQVRSRVSVVPLSIRFGDEEFIDGVTIDSRMFYEKLIESDVLPTTSQATPVAFASVFEEVANAGESAVVLIKGFVQGVGLDSAVQFEQGFAQIIDLILFIASDKGQFINGENIMIDGGRAAMPRRG